MNKSFLFFFKVGDVREIDVQIQRKSGVRRKDINFALILK